MSEVLRLLVMRKRYAKEWKIVVWMLGMTLGVFLITDGKTTSEHPLLHLLLGAVLGLLIGFALSRNLKANNSAD